MRPAITLSKWNNCRHVHEASQIFFWNSKSLHWWIIAIRVVSKFYQTLKGFKGPFYQYDIKFEVFTTGLTFNWKSDIFSLYSYPSLAEVIISSLASIKYVSFESNYLISSDIFLQISFSKFPLNVRNFASRFSEWTKLLFGKRHHL